ncbi:helix-turn-helix domain-containing protein [Limnohabitans sp. Jir72]|uniref:helix-turn-helix domain-containing protein n=1 Tax=Limnohabitans sp. Jir72 TaxID=1977909 RepID=UPI000D34C7E2|nr:helix-turn-helix domain-containing protein [Limnohabitans sp. Jir72]PUE31602.1 Fis family transcriptional regulator [Limnohabitans sp. Jir72]
MFTRTSGLTASDVGSNYTPFFVSTRAQRIAMARQQFFEEGVRPTGLVSEAVIQSWMRCTSGRHQTSEALEFNHVSSSRMHATLARNQELLAAASQELVTMEASLSGMECRVLLTDAQGVIVHGTHNPLAAHEALLSKATRVGVNLAESRLGTTAPGITKHTHQACTVTGAEHYFNCLQALECAAAPIHNVQGHVAAVLDITVEGRSFNFDAASVVGMYATSIENRLLMAQSHEHVVLRFQASPALLGTPMEALAGITADGQVGWLNGVASRLLGVPAFAEGRDVASLLGLELAEVLAMTRRSGLQAIRLPNGLGVWGQANLLARDGIHFGQALTYTAASVLKEGPAATQALAEPVSANPQTESAAPNPAANDDPIQARLSDHHHQLIDSTLAACNGNISRAARTLGVSRGVLYRHLRNQPAASDKLASSQD